MSKASFILTAEWYESSQRIRVQVKLGRSSEYLSGRDKSMLLFQIAVVPLRWYRMKENNDLRFNVERIRPRQRVRLSSQLCL